jgi:hypothetical protein
VADHRCQCVENDRSRALVVDAFLAEHARTAIAV